jgi:predicted Ser/Thr protein kinase
MLGKGGECTVYSMDYDGVNEVVVKVPHFKQSGKGCLNALAEANFLQLISGANLIEVQELIVETDNNDKLTRV